MFHFIDLVWSDYERTHDMAYVTKADDIKQNVEIQMHFKH